MRKFFLLNLLFPFIIMSIPNAQVRKIVLLEEATSTNCGDCAKDNPKLQTFFESHFGSVISMRYHGMSGDDDPMYTINPSENSSRIKNYYGIYWYPTYLMDGINYAEPFDSLNSSLMIDRMNHHLSKDAPVKIKIIANIDADSVRATLRLIGISPVSQTNLKFRAAIIERMVKYSSPPGYNGETTFPDVMRKMLPDTNGYAVDNINPGEEITYYVSYPVNPVWKWQDLAVVAWLQSDENQETIFGTTNHEVIQSNISIPTYIIQSDSPLAEFLSANQNVSKTLKIINDNEVDLHLRLKVTETQVPAGWSYNFSFNNISFDSVDVTITPGDSIVFGLNVNTGFDSGILRLAVFVYNLDDPYNYGNTANYFGITKTENSNVLFIDDDGGKNSETFYFTAFDGTGIRYTSIEGGLVSVLEKQLFAENFKAVFWNISEGSSSFSQFDINFLENYLNGGGNLFIAVSTPELFYGWDIKGVTDFYLNYLDAKYYGYFTHNSFTGVAGTLGDGITTNLNGSYQGIIRSYSGLSDTIFQYTDTSNYGGLSYDAGIYKTVFLGVGLEQFTSASARQSLIQNIMNWFEVPVGVLNEKFDVPTQYKLEQNYPNPFNPITNIGFRIANFGFVSLKVYDILGNKVATLVNGEKPAGNYKVKFDGRNLSSGVYFYRIKAGNFIETKKLILMK